MNRLGVKFSRLGFAKYLAHLDLQRLFSRAVRRAGIPAQYSQGFNPHINMSFASPLAVGVESLGDYFEFFIAQDIDLGKAADKLNENMPKGFAVLEIGILPEKGKKLMAVTQAASYEIIPEEEVFAAWMQAFFASDNYMVKKERKGKTRTFDARPLLYAFEIKEDGTILATMANSGNGSLSPLFLFGVASRELGSNQQGRVIRQDLLTEMNGELSSLSSLLQ